MHRVVCICCFSHVQPLVFLGVRGLSLVASIRHRLVCRPDHIQQPAGKTQHKKDHKAPGIRAQCTVKGPSDRNAHHDTDNKLRADPKTHPYARVRHVVIATFITFSGRTFGLNLAKFLAELLPALEIGRPVIVSPSMSGALVFPLILEHPELVAGFVPVAPVGTPKYAPRLEKSPIPTLVFWGEEDEVFPVSQAKTLAASFAKSKVVILPGAAHPAYLDQPERFHQALVEFISGLAD